MNIILIILLIAAALFAFHIYRYNEGLDETCNKIDTLVIDSGIPGPVIGFVGGVHGNEPAGTYTLSKMIENGEFKPKKGKIVVIRRANPCGLAKNVRENPWTGNDINRQFSEKGGSDDSSRQIIKDLEGCHMIIDFHE